MFITICVIAYNEEQTLPAILKDIAAQDYAHGSMEVVLVDSASSDHTKKIMQEFAAQNTTPVSYTHLTLPTSDIV